MTNIGLTFNKDREKVTNYWGLCSYKICNIMCCRQACEVAISDQGRTDSSEIPSADAYNNATTDSRQQCSQLIAWSRKYVRSVDCV